MASVASQARPPEELIVVAADPDEREAVRALLDGIDFAGRAEVVASDRCLLGGGARNLGWRSATGDVVLFLDDDDYWAADKVGDHVAAHDSGQSDVVYSGVWYVFPGARDARPYNATPVAADMVRGLTLDGLCPPTTSCVSIRRAALEAVGGFDETLPSYQDWELWYRLALAGSKFASLPQPLTYFVQHEGGRVSMNIEGRSRAAGLVLAKHGSSPDLVAFFGKERRQMLERVIVFSAQRGEWTCLDTFRRALSDKIFSPLEWRPYWIAAKVAGNLALASVRRNP